MGRRAMGEGEMVARARALRQKLGRTPLQKEFPPGFTKTILKYYGTYRAFLQRAIGEDAAWHKVSDDELIAVARRVYAAGSIPSKADFKPLGRHYPTMIDRRWGSFSNFLAAAIGMNPQSLLLRSIAELTRPPVDECSTNELERAIGHKGFSRHRIGTLLGVLANQGMVTVHRRRNYSLYQLTPAGRQAVATCK